jgi:hypothetical protein
MTTTNQERCAKLEAEMALVEKRGVDASADAASWWWAVAAETRYLIDILRGRDVLRAGAAANHAHEFFERSVKSNAPDAPIECAKGCSYCCSYHLTATAPEIFLVAEFIRREQAESAAQTREKVRVRDRETRYMNPDARRNVRMPCVLLSAEGACSVYAVRPSACRGVVSSSMSACGRDFAGERVTIPRPNLRRQISRAHVFALEAAMAAENLPTHHYDFAPALRIALDNPDAEERWLKGEDVFSAIATDMLDIQLSGTERQSRLRMLIAGALAQDIPE